MPLGPGAERAHDRAPYRGGGLRARRRRSPGRRRPAPRRAGRRALPGPLPGAPAREAGAAATPEARFHELGDLLFAVVNLARKMRIDPELSLRAAADRFRGRLEGGAELAAAEDRNWNDLAADEQLAYYARARLTEGD